MVGGVRGDGSDTVFIYFVSESGVPRISDHYPSSLGLPRRIHVFLYLFHIPPYFLFYETRGKVDLIFTIILLFEEDPVYSENIFCRNHLLENQLFVSYVQSSIIEELYERPLIGRGIQCLLFRLVLSDSLEITNSTLTVGPTIGLKCENRLRMHLEEKKGLGYTEIGNLRVSTRSEGAQTPEFTGEKVWDGDFCQGSVVRRTLRPRYKTKIVIIQLGIL